MFSSTMRKCVLGSFPRPICNLAISLSLSASSDRPPSLVQSLACLYASLLQNVGGFETFLRLSVLAPSSLLRAACLALCLALCPDFPPHPEIPLVPISSVIPALRTSPILLHLSRHRTWRTCNRPNVRGAQFRSCPWRIPLPSPPRPSPAVASGFTLKHPIPTRTIVQTEHVATLLTTGAFRMTYTVGSLPNLAVRARSPAWPPILAAPSYSHRLTHFMAFLYVYLWSAVFTIAKLARSRLPKSSGLRKQKDGCLRPPQNDCLSMYCCLVVIPANMLPLSS